MEGLSAIWDAILDALGTVLAFFYAIVPSYGIAIIGLTILIRLALFPLTAKQARSMLAMQRIQPEIKKLQAKYKDDRQRLNEEVMAFYKENKVNPFAGCLPLVAQAPIFIALFNILRNPFAHIPEGSSLYDAFCGGVSSASCNPGGLSFLGMDLSLSAQDSHGSFAAALPFFALVLLVGLSGYLQSKQSMRYQSQANPQTQMIGRLMPLIFMFISLSLPAGVVLYFLVSNVWQIGQQEVIFRREGQVPVVKAAAAKTPGSTRQKKVERPAGSDNRGGKTRTARAKSRAGSSRSRSKRSSSARTSGRSGDGSKSAARKRTSSSGSTDQSSSRRKKRRKR